MPKIHKDPSATPANYKKLKEISYGKIAEGEASYGEALSTEVQDANWTAILDSGCRNHMFISDSNIENMRPSAKVIRQAMKS
jgi:hypothetical protein